MKYTIVLNKDHLRFKLTGFKVILTHQLPNIVDSPIALNIHIFRANSRLFPPPFTKRKKLITQQNRLISVRYSNNYSL